MRGRWTRVPSLPGGDFSHDRREALAADLASTFPFVDAAVAGRLAATYGTLARGILSGAATVGDLGVHFGHGFYEREVEHLVSNEWAVSADDILWRRTKLGLRLGEAQRSRLADWLAARVPAGGGVTAA